MLKQAGEDALAAKSRQNRSRCVFIEVSGGIQKNERIMADDFPRGCPCHAGDDAPGGILLDYLLREVISPDGVPCSVTSKSRAIPGRLRYGKNLSQFPVSLCLKPEFLSLSILILA